METIENKLSRWKAFWQRRNQDRPLIGFTGSYFPRETIELLTCRDRPIQPDDIDIPAFLSQCDQQHSAWSAHTGDAIWSAAPLWGLPWLRAVFGRSIYVGDDTIWNNHTAISYDDIHASCDLDQNPWLDLLLELATRLAEHAQGRYSLGPPSVCGPSVLLNELRGLTEFVLDLVDCPEQVTQTLSKITECYVKVLNLYYDRIPTWHGGYASGTRFLWTPGRQIEYDEDSNYLFSPKLQEQFIMPSHRRMAEKIEFAYIHLHSTQLHTLDNLLADERLLYYELCPDVGYDMSELISALRRIVARRCVIVHAFFSAEDIAAIIESVPLEGLCILTRADTPEQAASIQEEVMTEHRWCKTTAH